MEVTKIPIKRGLNKQNVVHAYKTTVSNEEGSGLYHCMVVSETILTECSQSKKSPEGGESRKTHKDRKYNSGLTGVQEENEKLVFNEHRACWKRWSISGFWWL